MAEKVGLKTAPFKKPHKTGLVVAFPALKIRNFILAYTLLWAGIHPNRGWTVTRLVTIRKANRPLCQAQSNVLGPYQRIMNGEYGSARHGFGAEHPRKQRVKFGLLDYNPFVFLLPHGHVVARRGVVGHQFDMAQMELEMTDNKILDDLMSEADRSVVLGDALDMKGNIWLVVITFLATQTAYFLTTDITSLEHHAQVLSAILLVIAGMLTLVELRPQTYILFQPSNGALEQRLEQLRSFYAEHKDSEDSVLEEFTKDQMRWAKERAIKNQEINVKKSQLISWSFWLTASAAAINFGTLLHFLKFFSF